MRKVLLTAVLLLAGGALATGMAAALRDEPPDYRAVTVSRGDIELLIAATGKVRPKESVDVGAQVSGQLEAIHVDVGDLVTQGQLLAEIDPTLAQARVDQGRAQLAELRATLLELDASRDLARAKARRAEMLRAEDAISEADYEIAVAEEKITAARQVQLAAQIERQESTLQADLANLDYTKIYAPIAGTVVAQLAVEGQTLNANQTTPTVLTIADLTVMTVEAEISEADVLRIEAGQSATFKLLGSDREWQTTVRQVLPQPEIVNDVVLFKALLDVANPDGALRPEMTAQVFFLEGRAEDAVLVPVAALRDARATPPASPAPGQPRSPAPQSPPAAELAHVMKRHPGAQPAVVLIRDGARTRRQTILVGLQNRVHAEVLHGLEPGDEVLIGKPAGADAAAARSRRPFGFGRR